MLHGQVAPLVDRLNALEQVQKLVQHPPLVRKQELQLLTNQFEFRALGLDAVQGKVVVLQQLLPDLAELSSLGAVHGQALGNRVDLE